METTYKMTSEMEQLWRGKTSRIWRKHIQRLAKSKARDDGASVVTIETPTGLIVDTLEVA